MQPGSEAEKKKHKQLTHYTEDVQRDSDWLAVTDAEQRKHIDQRDAWYKRKQKKQMRKTYNVAVI